MKWFLIANPGAGDGGSATQALRLVERFGMTMDRVESTTGAGDGLVRARQASGFEGIVVVGGDGTVAEVLEGMDRAQQTLAIIPTGHGNCLARSLGLDSVATAVDALRRPRTRVVDLVETVAHLAGGGERRVLSASTLAFGYVSDVVALGRTRLARLGRYAYAAAALVTQPRWLQARITVDGAPAASGPFTSIIVNNSDYLANFRAFPNGRLDDGRLDVMAIGAGWAGQMLHNISVLSGRYFYDPARTWQPVSVRVDLQAAELLMVDGEFIPGVIALEARCLPAAVRCVGAAP
jgi:diacylglycerol kinase family enzyme